MEIRSMVYRPRQGFFIKSARIALLIAVIALIIVSIATNSIAAGNRHSSDFNKAKKYYNKGKYEQAIPLLRKYIKTKPEPDALFMLGYSLYKLGRHDEARKYFQESYLVKPEYTPTPEIEKKLNRRLKTARPGPQDTKQAVPQGTLPPEAQGLDPSQYKVIDNTSRLKMPETTKSTDTFRPAARKRPVTKKRTKPATVTAKKETSKPVIEKKPVADKPAPVPAPEPVAVPAPAPAIENKPAPTPVPAQVPAPAVENKPSPTPVPAPSAAIEKQTDPEPTTRTQPARRPTPRQTPVEPETKSILDQLPPIPEWLAPYLESGIIFIALGVALVIFFLFSLPLFLIARKLGVSRPILAFVPILQNWTFTYSAGLSFIWGLLITILPILGIYPLMLISERLGKGRILGLILVILLGPIGLLLLALIGKAGGAAGATAGTDMLNLSGEPELDLPDMDDLGFDIEEDAFATDEGFGSDEGMGAHTDDFGTAESETVDDFDLEPGEDDFDTTGGDDDFSLDNMNLGESEDLDFDDRPI